jgi:hypothetical protein
MNPLTAILRRREWDAERAAVAAYAFNTTHRIRPTPAQLGAALGVPERVARRRLDLARKLGLYS